MRTRILIASLLATAAIASVAVTAGDASPNLKAFADAMGAAPSFSAQYSVQPVGGASTEYSVAFSKPDKARIETADTLTVADGNNVTVYDKNDNSYYVKPQTENELMGLFSTMELAIWKPFFRPDAIKAYAASKDAGTKVRSGKTLNVVTIQADPKGDMTLKLYTDQADNTLKQGEINVSNAGKGTETSVLLVTQSSMSAGADLFAFKAPDGAKKLEASNSKPGEFTTDFWAALAQAKATGKLLMVDFMASWCGPCKMMDAEVFHSDKFKEASKDFILVKVDVDVQKDVAQKYNITAMPTVKFIRGDGSVVHEFVGYGGPDKVYSDMDQARNAR